MGWQSLCSKILPGEPSQVGCDSGRRGTAWWQVCESGAGGGRGWMVG